MKTPQKRHYPVLMCSPNYYHNEVTESSMCITIDEDDSIISVEDTSKMDTTTSSPTPPPKKKCKRGPKPKPSRKGYFCIDGVCLPWKWFKTPILRFQGKEMFVCTKDGQKYCFRKGSGRFLVVTLFDDDFPKKRKYNKNPPVKIEQCEDSDIEIIEVVKKSKVPKIPLAPPPDYRHTTANSITTALGKVEIKKNLPYDPEEGLKRMKIFDHDNLSYYIEAHVQGYIEYLDTVVMNKDNQARIWEKMKLLQIPVTDERMSGILDSVCATDEELIDACHMFKRAIHGFIGRVYALYYFLFPHMAKADQCVRSEIPLQIWHAMSNAEKETTYWTRSSFDTEFLHLIARFPPGNLERRVLERVFPNGSRVLPTPTYDDIVGDFFGNQADVNKRKISLLEWELIIPKPEKWMPPPPPTPSRKYGRPSA